MKKYFTFISFLFSLSSFGQITINGTVLNKETKEPLAGANVFVNNTSYKTVTNAKGSFVFANLNIQRGELIVNALGYKHEVINIDTKTETDVTIHLMPQAKQLDAVVVFGFEKDGFKKWGNLFVNCFIGTTHKSVDCKIENIKALKFYYDKKSGGLSVIANEPLKIINKALGYEVDYTLETFEYNTKQRILFYSGYPVFTDIQSSKKKMLQWIEKRNECYKGSIMHFMRTLYRNKLNEEGFIVQKAIKILNEKKAAYKNQLNEQLANQQKVNGVITLNANDINDDQKLMQEPDSIYKIISQVLPTDSFAFGIDSSTAGMFFEKHLIVSYKIEKLNTTVSSFVKLLYEEPISIFQNGSYYNSLNFFTERYWAENEKIARLLPFDFLPEQQLKKE